MNSKTFQEFIDCIKACISDEYVYKVGPYKKRIACYMNCIRLVYQCIALSQGFGINTAMAIGDFEAQRISDNAIYDATIFLEESEEDVKE